MSVKVAAGVTEAAIEAGVKQLGIRKLFANTNMNFWDDLISSATTAGLKGAGIGAAVGGIRGTATGEGFFQGAAHGAVWGGAIGTAGGMNARMNEHLRGTYGRTLAGDGGFSLGTASRLQNRLRTEANASQAASSIARGGRAKVAEANFDRALGKYLSGGASSQESMDDVVRWAQNTVWNSPNVGSRNRMLDSLKKGTAQEMASRGTFSEDTIKDTVDQILGGIRPGSMA